MFRNTKEVASEPHRKQARLLHKKDKLLVDMVHLLNDAGTVSVDELQQHQLEQVMLGLGKERRIELILRAVAAGRLDILCKLREPIEEGGYGWSLDVKALDGRTPVSVAASLEGRDILLHLLTPVASDGFGLSLDKVALDVLLGHSALNMRAVPGVMYRKKKLTRQHSFIEYTDPLTGAAEIYTHDSELGKGSFGSVRLFRCVNQPEKKVVLKQLHLNEDMSVSGVHMLNSVSQCGKEMLYMQMAYPDLKPFRYKHSIHRATRQLSSLFVMPFIPGLRLHEVIKDAHRPEHFFHLLFSVAKELQRIHALDIVHGDVKIFNIMVADLPGQGDVVPNYNVRFVDFGFACMVGRVKLPFVTHVIYQAPELFRANTTLPVAEFSQDVYSFGCIVYYAYTVARDKFPQIKEQYPGLIQYLKDFANRASSGDSVARPPLAEFISNLGLLMNIELKHRSQLI